jgi:long-chain acyl-CoA synthetase
MPIHGRPLVSPARPPGDVLRAGLDADPGGVAVAGASRALSWAALDERSTAVAAGYRALGLARGDRLASLMANRIDLLVHYLACAKAALVAVPLNYRYTAREIDHALAVSGAKALLSHVERDPDLAESRLATDLPSGTIAYDDGGGAGAGATWRFEELARDGGSRGRADLTRPHPADPAIIFFTSGSTGAPKGVTHTHETLAWMIASASAGLRLSPVDAFLPGSSMSHVGSFLWAFAALSVGARVIVARSFDAYEVLPLLREHRPTVLAMIPAALLALVREHDVSHEDFASLRVCRSGSDKVSTALLAEFAALAGFPIDEGYGMTEVGLATLNPPAGTIKPGSIGVPVDGFSVSVRDDDGAELGPERVGRVWIRSRSRMAGSWNAPEATAAVVRDDWLDSGDLARADRDGYLWFFGRKKQIIVHDGSNISPLEVEGALAEHPAIALAGVVGIHDEVHGENVRAYVTLRPGAPRPASAELVTFCRDRIGYKAPEEIVVLAELPLNPTGKIDRVTLKRLAEDHLHPHGLG